MPEGTHGYWLPEQADFSALAAAGVFNWPRLEYHPPLEQGLALDAGRRFPNEIRFRAARKATTMTSAFHGEKEGSCFRFGFTGVAVRGW